MAIGDILYRGASVWLRLVGNTTTTRKFLNQTGNGTSAAAPSWDAITEADIASALSNTTSAHNALSNVVSALSASHTSLVNRVSVNSATGGSGSVTSNEVSAVSAQAASALSQAVSAISQSFSVTNANVSNLTSAHNALSNVVSNMISAGGGGVSVTSNELSAVSAQAKSALSDAMSVGTATADSLSNAISALSDAHTSLVNRVSANSATGGTGSVTSTELSAVSAQAASALSQAVSVLSQTISVTNAAVSNLTSAHNALSNVVSGLTGGGGEQIVYAANDQVISNSSALTDDASLVFSVTSAATYRWEAWLMMIGNSTTHDYKFGLSIPTSATVFWGPESGLVGTDDSWDGVTSATTPRALMGETSVLTRGSNSGAGGTIRYPVIIKGVMFTGQTAGTFRLKWAQAAAVALDATRKAGSHIAYRKISP